MRRGARGTPPECTVTNIARRVQRSRDFGGRPAVGPLSGPGGHAAASAQHGGQAHAAGGRLAAQCRVDHVEQAGTLAQLQAQRAAGAACEGAPGGHSRA